MLPPGQTVPGGGLRMSVISELSEMGDPCLNRMLPIIRKFFESPSFTSVSR